MGFSNWLNCTPENPVAVSEKTGHDCRCFITWGLEAGVFERRFDQTNPGLPRRGRSRWSLNQPLIAPSHFISMSSNNVLSSGFEMPPSLQRPMLLVPCELSSVLLVHQESPRALLNNPEMCLSMQFLLDGTVLRFHILSLPQTLSVRLMYISHALFSTANAFLIWQLSPLERLILL